MKANLKMPSAISRFQTLIKHPQFIWWIGHCCVILCSLLYFFYSIIIFGGGSSFYYWAYKGAILSYSVVVYKLYGFPSLDWEYFRSINQDENVFYLGLALVWVYNPPILVTLIPYATFSLFHFVTYFRSNIIPTIAPAAAANAAHPGVGQGQNFYVNLSKGIQNWVLKNYEVAMRTVSFTEVVIITSTLILYIITWKIRLFTLFTYGLFLRIRYHMNPYTKLAFSSVSKQLDSWLLPPTADARIPPYVTNVYRHAKAAVSWAGQAGPQPSR